jgi:hypothetical protein
MTTFLEALAGGMGVEGSRVEGLPRLEGLPTHQLHRRVNAIVGDVPEDGQIFRLFYHDKTGRVECSFPGYHPIAISTEEWQIISHGVGVRASVDKQISFSVMPEPSDSKVVIEGWALEDAKTGCVFLYTLFDNAPIILHTGDSVRIGELPLVVSW